MRCMRKSDAALVDLVTRKKIARQIAPVGYARRGCLTSDPRLACRRLRGLASKRVPRPRRINTFLGNGRNCGVKTGDLRGNFVSKTEGLPTVEKQRAVSRQKLPGDKGSLRGGQRALVNFATGVTCRDFEAEPQKSEVKRKSSSHKRRSKTLTVCSRRSAPPLR
jgi:hypothetical protein